MNVKYPNFAVSLLLLGAFTIPMSAVARDDNGSSGDKHPDGRGDVVRGAARGALGQAVTTGNGIGYHGGPVMQGTTHVYYIWYGNWSTDAGANGILTNLASHIGGSPYFNINTTYGDTTGNVANSVTYAGSASDPGSLGTSLSDNDIGNLVANAIGSGQLPLDANGVYFVLTAPGVNETSGFLTQYCGWHTYGTLGSTNVKYAFVGDAQGPNLGACAVQSVSPNGDAGADAMASVIAHELEESATDPELDAWYDSAGYENADKCAWTYGTTYTAPNGSAANMALGGLNYLIQQNWLNAGGGKCALSYSTTPDFSVSVSPTSQTVIQGATTGNYTLKATPLNGFTGTVSWTLGTLPPGITASAISASGTFTLTAASTVALGTYSIPITGTSGSLSHSVSASLVVKSNATFTMTISPSSRTVARPSSGSVSTTYTVTLTRSGTFNSNVSLTVSGGQTGLTPTLKPTTIAGGSGTSTLTVVVTSSARLATRTLKVTGTGGGITKSVSATITVQ